MIKTRVELADLKDKYVTVTAYVKFKKVVKTGKTAYLLKLVNVSGIITDHCWLYPENFQDSKMIYDCDCSIGKFIIFNAVIGTYNKYDMNGNKFIDYNLLQVHNIRRVKNVKY